MNVYGTELDFQEKDKLSSEEAKGISGGLDLLNKIQTVLFEAIHKKTGNFIF